MTIARECSTLHGDAGGLGVADGQCAAGDDEIERPGDEGVRQALRVGYRHLERLRGRLAGLERACARRNEILLVDRVDLEELRAELVGLCEPLLGGLRASEHRERQRAMTGELVAERRLLEVTERGVCVIQRLERGDRAVGGDLDDREDVVGVRMAPAGGDLSGDLAGHRRVVARVLELTDRAERDREVSVGTHRGEPAGRRALERDSVVLGGCARVGEAHREMPQRHRYGHAPGAVLQAFGDVLGEP